MIGVRAGDYVVVAPAKGRNFLLKAKIVQNDMVSGVVEEDCHITALRQAIDVSREDIILNVGADPYPGNAFGADTSRLYRGKKLHPDMGNIHFFYRPDKEVGAKLWHALSRFYRWAKANRLAFLTTDDIIWEIEAFEGQKYSGMYVSGNETVAPRIIIRPEKFEPQVYMFVIAHEMGHHIEVSRCNHPPLHAAWIRLFNTSIKVADIDADVHLELRDRLLDGEDTPSTFKSVLDADTVPMYRQVLQVIRSRHAVGPRELDILFENGYRDDIKALWPTDTIRKKDLAPIISDYATVNWHEAFAEAFAYYVMGYSLPKNVTKLLDKSLSFARSQ